MSQMSSAMSFSSQAPRPGSSQALARAREARAIAIDEVRRLRGAHVLQNRLAAAQQRATMARSASQTQLIEAGRERDYQQARAVEKKYEQESRKQLEKEAEHVARARERRVKAARVEEEKARAQLEVAAHNREEESRRQVMLERVALQEAEVRKRLASEILQVDEAVRQRKRSIEEKKQVEVLERAKTLEAHLRRAQSAKSIREVAEIQKIRQEAAFREGARDVRVARAKVAKESERLEFVRRNAEEEARRVRGIEQVQRAEAENKLRLVGELVRADVRGKDRLKRTASEKVLETVKLAQERENKIAIAAQAKAEREARTRQQIAAAAALKEKARKARAEHALEAKEQQRLYYVQRNMMQEARFEQRGQDYFEQEMRPATAGPSLSHSASAASLSRVASSERLNRPSTPPSKQWGSEMALGGQPSASFGNAGLAGYAAPLPGGGGGANGGAAAAQQLNGSKSFDWLMVGQ